MADITLNDLTTGAVDGTGVFDKLMQVTKAHILEEYTKGRIKGAEYAEVYLGAVQATMERALGFLLAHQKASKELALLDIQIANATKEGLLLDKQALQLDAQTTLINTQNANATAEGLNIPKQGLILDAQKTQLAAETSRVNQQTTNLVAEALNIPKQGLVLDGQKCLLDAQFDLTQEQKLKAIAETAVLTQKKVTEQAQTSSIGVDPDSVVGKQKALYTAQTKGFEQNAVREAAKLLTDTWNVRRTTDDATVADTTNKLDDATIGRAITALLTSVNA